MELCINKCQDQWWAKYKNTPSDQELSIKEVDA